MHDIFITYVAPIIQIIIALGLINVWLLRSGSATQYRGGAANNISQEFAVYGLPQWSVYVVGALKITIAVLLISNIVVPHVVGMAAWWALVVLVVLMVGALTMHLKVGDKPLKALPAGIMLVLVVVALWIG